jgi:hypothetical protein
MAKTVSKPSTPKPATPKPVPSHGKGGKINESQKTGTGPRTPKK